ncbi:MAG: gluconokinase [Lewinella sp.]|nr:gluconokinase [Lewinella sp.]
MTKHSNILIVMGVSGVGKTTIGRGLSTVLAIPFFDADDYHPPANVVKMSQGIPLNDDDRAPWLERLAHLLAEKENGSGAILACSALKDSYRRQLASRLRQGPYWIYLQGSPALIRRRMEARRDHYMPPGLLDSQLATLEPPDGALTVSVADTPEQIISTILMHLDQ